MFPGILAGLLSAPEAIAATAFSWQEGDGFRTADLFVHAPGSPGFRRLSSAATGLVFTNVLTDAASAANRVLENGSGVAVGDYDGDDWPDIFLCSLTGHSVLFHNLGHLRFVDATPASGITTEARICRGAVFADVNGDRRPDLLVSTLADGVLCFLNLGGGHFRDATAEAGLADLRGATTLALADVDGNGSVDLYVARYRAEDVRDDNTVEVRVVGGRAVLHPKYSGRLAIGSTGLVEFGEPDALFLNDGAAHFRVVPWTTGVFLDESGKPLTKPPLDWGLSAAFHDLNGDGYPDLYVCNDYWTPDRLWLNNGDGTFRAAPATALRHTSENSMGVDFADVDLDGHVDFLVLDMLSRDHRRRCRQALAQTPPWSSYVQTDVRPQYMRNCLFRNRGDGSFDEIADYAGLAASEWSWQPLFLDVDLDGLPDVIASAGHGRDLQDLDATERIRALQHPWPPHLDARSRQLAFTRELAEHARLYPTLALPISAFRNQGSLRFEPVGESWGFHEPAVHQGIAAGDFDRDGDLDLVVNVLNGPAALYRNDGGANRVAVRLRGDPPNTAGIGSRIILRGGAVATQFLEISSGGRYLSGSDELGVFAAGSTPESMSLEVVWRNGRRTRLDGVKANRLYEIAEAQAVPAEPRLSASPTPLFEDLSEQLPHRHVENPFDDFSRQPLLPHRLSREGPALCCVDLNRDGWIDLIVGAAAGTGSGVFTNNGHGAFCAAADLLPGYPRELDQAGIVAWPAADGSTRILVASSREENPGSSQPAVVETSTAMPQRALPILESGPSSPGPLALADLDGDGDLDLFMGARDVAGRYPESAPSHLLIRDGERWREDSANAAVLRDLGLVRAGVWTDLNDDGAPDLAVATEWGPIRILRNEGGRLRDVTRDLGLAGLTGWWTGVAAVDLDGDGRLDLVATNWGLNSPSTASAEHPAILCYGDFLGRGNVDLLEATWDATRQVPAPVHGLDRFQAAFPGLRERFPRHDLFCEATLEDLLAAFPFPAKRLEARTLASMAFLNRGRQFEAVELPREAQWAPASGIAVADFDGDGHDDVFLSQNQWTQPWQSPRQDAGRGLLLLGGQGGHLRTAPNSGIRILGDQRAAAVADVDGDGRPDLFVAQNGDSTRLLRNRGAVAGLRLRLRGPPGNPDGIGAVVRLRFDTGFGPARAVVAGGGYLSQDDATLVLGTPHPVLGVLVRWPGGRRMEVPLPPSVREATLGYDGNVQVMR